MAKSSPGDEGATELDLETFTGTDMDRIKSLSDGIFGFAITLLVLSLVVPSCSSSSGAAGESCLVHALGGDGNLFLAYVFSFFVLGVWWVQHHIILRFFQSYNPELLWSNLLFLLSIAVTPFILGVSARFFDVQIAVALFGLVEAFAGGMLLVIWEVGVAGRLLKPSATPGVIRRFRRRGVITPLLFLVSAGVGLESVRVAHFVWLALFVEIMWFQLIEPSIRLRKIHRAAPG